MRYNPTEKVEGGGRAQPGEYAFVVEAAEETMFRSGNEGCKLTLQVAAMTDRDIKVFDYLIYQPQSLWRTEEFLTCLGFDFQRPPEVHQLVGKMGKASFITDKETGYLRVKNYVSPSANNGPDSRRTQPQTLQQQRLPSGFEKQTPYRPARAPAMRTPGDDDIPF
jgi:hypothetical protein